MERELPSREVKIPTYAHKSTFLVLCSDVDMTEMVVFVFIATVPAELFSITNHSLKGKKVKASHTRHRALGPELIPVYRQSACR